VVRGPPFHHTGENRKHHLLHLSQATPLGVFHWLLAIGSWYKSWTTSCSPYIIWIHQWPADWDSFHI
jgi:hypothetical protein